MSYKEVREFAEIMRAMECPYRVDLESFQYPDFPLVAKVLRWLVLRCDPSFQVPLEIEAEQDRVFFLNAITDHLNFEYGLALDPRKIYRADGHAVREMLKFVRILNEASKPEVFDIALNMDDDLKAKALAKIMDLQTFRKQQENLATQGAHLYEKLQAEPDNHQIRLNALNLKSDPAKIEQSLNQSVTDAETLAEEYAAKFENIEFDKASLEAKIKKREEELDRMQRRYQSLQGSKPGFTDESAKLEQDLKELYTRYCVRFRNLIGLDNQVKLLERALKEKEKAAAGKDESEVQRIDDLRAMGIDAGTTDDGFNEESPGDASENEHDRRRSRGLIVRENAVDEVSIISHASNGNSDEEAEERGQAAAAKRVNGNPPALSSDEDF